MNDVATGNPLACAAPQPALAAARTVPRVALRTSVSTARFYATFAMGAGFPAVAGVLLYGWRALAMLLFMLPTSTIAFLIWRHVGSRGRQLHLAHTLWLTMLLWLMLPAHLLAGPPLAQSGEWAIPLCASILLVMALWLLGGMTSGRIHAVLVAYLLIVAAFDQMLAPMAVLQRHRLFRGDIARAAPPAPPAHAYIKEGYLKTPPVEGADALLLEPASTRLLAFTSGQKRPGRSWLTLESLLRDELPPLEDLIIGGQPGPIGGTCAIAVIIGGLFLLYRGIIDFRVPVCVFVGALLALLTLPIPILIRDSGPEWRWLAFRMHLPISGAGVSQTVGWAKMVTFANYEIMIGPMLLMAFFLATAPALRPMARRARVLYGLLLGIVAAGMQLYVSISFGPYLALLIVSLLTPLFDRMFRQHPLV